MFSLPLTILFSAKFSKAEESRLFREWIVFRDEMYVSTVEDLRFFVRHAHVAKEHRMVWDKGNGYEDEEECSNNRKQFTADSCLCHVDREKAICSRILVAPENPEVSRMEAGHEEYFACSVPDDKIFMLKSSFGLW